MAQPDRLYVAAAARLRIPRVRPSAVQEAFTDKSLTVLPGEAARISTASPILLFAPKDFGAKQRSVSRLQRVKKIDNWYPVKEHKVLKVFK